MDKSRLRAVPDEPLTILERMARACDEEYLRAEALARQVADLHESVQRGREAEALNRLMLAATRNVVAAHEAADGPLLDEAVARLAEIVLAT